MFPRFQRLTEKRLFGLIFRRGKRSKGRDFSIIYLPANKQGKIGFIVTKKIAKSAVVRNKLKRKLRAAFLSVLRTTPYNALLDRFNLVIVVQRNTADQPFDVLVKEIHYRLYPLTKEQR